MIGVNAEGKVDRPTWKAIQQAMNDSQKFVESLHHISWKEGLSEEILKGVQSFLSASNGGDVIDSDLGAVAAGASASNYQSSPGRASIASGTVYVLSYFKCQFQFKAVFDFLYVMDLGLQNYDDK